ncbi:bifunctional UDP-2,4-diacetamido-2,4,6-trideoxy-beta-L-altropyranose hydrolase/GNAT family N-acetyltransferase [Microbacterium profundi]|uniref:bifunctional UDP-2,4-diacetamido-2,4,6-trideoxy-beta-L-altropyranose hydrolase/GNAT family N-acetyltransferase n=1 Tax=Microbacterium profundi TaxID=450380 RepID=UPI00051A4F0F|nr:bifunctional UDP-2,4-diacetamido-2,4,6-trideoxy-beta-L-altropyranose hydrolase/GNAT family N-acetyltransferase [Microbacterium profundi]
MTHRDVLIHCNAGTGYGMGHLMRALALAQEAARRDWRVRIAGDISDLSRAKAIGTAPDVPFQFMDPSRMAEELPELAEDAAVLHIDSYWDVPELSREDLLLSNMQDGIYGVRRAHLAIDANLGAEFWFERPDLSTHRILGIDATVIRDQVRRQREFAPVAGDRPRVLVVMGGTDPDALAARAAEALTTVSQPLAITVIAAAERHRRIIDACRHTPHQLTLHTFVEDLPAVAREQDLIISAAGTSVWDFAYIGVPMALVCAVDNQRRGYRAAIDAGFAVPLGEPPHNDLAERVQGLASLFTDRNWTQQSREHLRASVDGLGAWRIVSAWEELAGIRSQRGGTPQALTARRATADDARTLFDWRNDDTTRAMSRDSSVLKWESHRAWLERCLADADRQLFLIEDGHRNVATVRWDRRAGSDWEISITVAPVNRGRGLGRAALIAGENALISAQPIRMLARVHENNAASRRLFLSAGYLPHLPADANGFETHAKWRLLTAR